MGWGGMDGRTLIADDVFTADCCALKSMSVARDRSKGGIPRPPTPFSPVFTSVRSFEYAPAASCGIVPRPPSVRCLHAIDDTRQHTPGTDFQSSITPQQEGRQPRKERRWKDPIKSDSPEELTVPKKAVLERSRQDLVGNGWERPDGNTPRTTRRLRPQRLFDSGIIVGAE